MPARYFRGQKEEQQNPWPANFAVTFKIFNDSDGAFDQWLRM
jgi:hypothetical protein